MRSAESIFEVLAEPNRRHILDLLRERGLVEVRQVAQRRVYRIEAC